MQQNINTVLETANFFVIFRRDPVVMKNKVERNRADTSVTLVPRLCTIFSATLRLSIL